MRTSDSPYLADWFAVLLRWLALLGLVASIALANRLTFWPGLVLFVGALWNTVVSILAILNRRLPFHRPVNTGVDLIASLALFVACGGLTGPVAWASLLALFSAAIYYEWKGSLIVSLILSAAQAGLIYLEGLFPLVSMPVGLLFGFNILGGVLIGMLGMQLIRGLRINWKATVQQRTEAEQNTLRQERTRIQTLYELVSSLSSTLNYQQVLEIIIDLSAKTLSGPEGAEQLLVSAVLLFDNDVLKVASARRLTPADQRAALTGTDGVIAEALENGQPCLLRDPAQDPELRRLAAIHACQVAIVLPLRTGRNVYGVLLYAHPQPEYFSPERREILDVINHQAVSAIQNASLYHDLEREKERIVESQEEARKKLARDLHDGPTQIVAAIAMRAGLARRVLQQDPQGVAAELFQIEEMARRTTNEIRHMLFTLRPLVLESEGLGAALNVMAQKMRETFDQDVRVDVDPRLVNLMEIGKQTVVFYLAEEAVTNARKHAQATHIWVRLRPVPQEPEMALLEIEDDGVGFDTAQIDDSYGRSGSLGMVNLKERTELINGLLNIVSNNGHGTRIQVFVPLTEAAVEKLRNC